MLIGISAGSVGNAAQQQIAAPFLGNYVDFDSADAVASFTATCGRNTLIGFTDADATGTFTSSLVPMQVIGLSDAIATCEFTATCEAGQLIAFTDADASGSFTASCTGESVSVAKGAIVFDGTTNLTKAGSDVFAGYISGGLTTFTKWGFAYWIKYSTLPGGGGAGGLDNTANFASTRCIFTDHNTGGPGPDHRLQFRMTDGAGGSVFNETTSLELASAMDTTDYHFYAGEIDTVNDTLKVWFDSTTPVLSTTFSPSVIDFKADADLFRLAGGGILTKLRGAMANFSMFANENLDIAALYNSGTVPTASAVAALPGCISCIPATANVNDDLILGTGFWGTVGTPTRVDV